MGWDDTIASKGPAGLYLCSIDLSNSVPGPAGRYLYQINTGPMGRMNTLWHTHKDIGPLGLLVQQV